MTGSRTKGKRTPSTLSPSIPRKSNDRVLRFVAPSSLNLLPLPSLYYSSAQTIPFDNLYPIPRRMDTSHEFPFLPPTCPLIRYSAAAVSCRATELPADSSTDRISTRLAFLLPKTSKTRCFIVDRRLRTSRIKRCNVTSIFSVSR